jgi:hypothetical protein
MLKQEIKIHIKGMLKNKNVQSIIKFSFFKKDSLFIIKICKYFVKYTNFNNSMHFLKYNL